MMTIRAFAVGISHECYSQSYSKFLVTSSQRSINSHIIVIMHSFDGTKLDAFGDTRKLYVADYARNLCCDRKNTYVLIPHKYTNISFDVCRHDAGLRCCCHPFSGGTKLRRHSGNRRC